MIIGGGDLQSQVLIHAIENIPGGGKKPCGNLIMILGKFQHLLDIVVDRLARAVVHNDQTCVSQATGLS